MVLLLNSYMYKYALSSSNSPTDHLVVLDNMKATWASISHTSTATQNHMQVVAAGSEKPHIVLMSMKNVEQKITMQWLKLQYGPLQQEIARKVCWENWINESCMWWQCVCSIPHYCLEALWKLEDFFSSSFFLFNVLRKVMKVLCFI